MLKESFCFLAVIASCCLGRAHAAEPAVAHVDKNSYNLMEKVKVSLQNNSPSPIFSELNEDTLVFEKKNAVGTWEQIQHKFICMPPDCYEDKGLFVPPPEIKPNETVNIEWLPRVFAGDLYNIPDDGVYRIKIPYGLQQIDTSLIAITPEFRIKDNVKGTISVIPAEKNANADETIKVKAQDRNSNGAFDSMIFNANIAVQQSGGHFIEGFLYSAQNQIRRCSLEATLKPGTHALIVDFDLNGLAREFLPVTAFVMTVQSPDGRVSKKQWRDDKKFRPAQFEGAGILLLEEGIKDEITTDGNLKISGRVRVFKKDEYTIWCNLFHPNDDVYEAKSVAAISTKVYLSSGEQEFAVVFNGTTLSMNKERGPFKPVFSISNKSSDWEDYSGDRGYITKSNVASLVKTVVLGNFTSAILDTDKDEDLDTLAISFDLDIPQDGKYFLILPLMDQKNKEIVKSGRLSGSKAATSSAIDFKKGRIRVTVEYGWGTIVAHGQDGPYHFEYGLIMSPDLNITDMISFTSPAYKLSDYPGKGVKTIKIVDDYPEDVNADGIYENLIAVAEVEMYEGGKFLSDYGMLVKSNGHMISGLSRLKNIDLKPGKQTIILRFPGTDINEEQADGPYLIHFYIETEGFGRILDVSCTHGSGGKLLYRNCTDGKDRRRDWTLINYKTKPYSYKSFSGTAKP
jgi:hypothetical protein